MPLNLSKNAEKAKKNPGEIATDQLELPGLKYLFLIKSVQMTIKNVILYGIFDLS